MRKSHTSEILAALSCALLATCSSGGGGGMSQSAASATSSNMATASQATVIDSEDTGIAGTVAAPFAATFGSAPPQLAVSGGPTFDGTSATYPSNVTFPLIITGLQKTSTGLSPAPSDPAATLTVINSSSNFSSVQVTIPSLGVNESFTLNSSLASGDNGQPIYGLSYVVTGQAWERPPGVTYGYSLTSDSPYVFGFETPSAAMPTIGTAGFTGGASGTAFKTVGTEIQTSNPISGNASISANFGTGAINGSFTQMTVTNTTAAGEEKWNDVSVTANIATGSNRFSGTTAAASAPGTPMSLSGSAVGHINGAFYGPAAQQLGAVWSLSDGTGSAIGTILAGH